MRLESSLEKFRLAINLNLLKYYDDSIDNVLIYTSFISSTLNE